MVVCSGREREDSDIINVRCIYILVPINLFNGPEVNMAFNPPPVLEKPVENNMTRTKEGNGKKTTARA